MDFKFKSIEHESEVYIGVQEIYRLFDEIQKEVDEQGYKVNFDVIKDIFIKIENQQKE
jgi:hypothetical protein